MKFALVNDKKEEATKGAQGICQVCGSELIAKCGEVKINHWAHKGNRTCDPWWENETDWHRAWKDKFPKEWQETVHFDESGEKHIADVKTSSGWCIEFQHSYLNPEERRARNAFYRKLVWVVDGTRRQTDKKQFQKILSESTQIPGPIHIRHVSFINECRLLKEWHDDNMLVFFDFQEFENTEQSSLWFLFSKIPSGDIYIAPFSRKDFIDLHNNNLFGELVANKISPILEILKSKKQIELANGLRGQSIVRSGLLERHMASMRPRRWRF
jgi:hypothetical protein